MEQNNRTNDLNKPAEPEGPVEEASAEQAQLPGEANIPASVEPTNLFDRFIEQFSSRELKTRVWGVVFLGFGLSALAVVLAYWLLTHDFYVADEPGLQAVKFMNLLTGSK